MNDEIPFLDELRSELMEHAPTGRGDRRPAGRAVRFGPATAAFSAFAIVLALGVVTWAIAGGGSTAPVAASTTTAAAMTTPSGDDSRITTTTTGDGRLTVPSADDPYRDWRFVSGVVDGEQLRPTATWPALLLELRREGGIFPVDCNRQVLDLGILRTTFMATLGARTAAGCSVNTREAETFARAIDRADTVQMDGGDLVLTGPDVTLRFAPVESPEMLAQLPFTAAGEAVEIPFPDERARGVVFTLTWGLEPASFGVSHLLTADASEGGASAQPWAGEVPVPDIEVTGPGPDRVVMPDDIGLGEHLICSPYWEPDWFCFPIEVRPAARDWFVTAGNDGIVLHDANGTSRVLREEPAALAFLVGDIVVFQAATGNGVPPAPTGPVMVLEGDAVRSVTGDRPMVLHDVGVADGRIVALTTGDDGAGRVELVDIATGDRTDLGPGGTSVRLHDGIVLVHSASGLLEARSTTGEPIWEYDAGDIVLVPAEDGILRLHQRRITDSIQYFDETLIAVADGSVISVTEHEMELPDDDGVDEIGGPCLRGEFDDGNVLCPQADGRMLVIQTSPQGWGADLLVPAHGIPTLVRSGL